MMPEIFLLWEFIILLFECLLLNPGFPEQLPEHPSLSGQIPGAVLAVPQHVPGFGAASQELIHGTNSSTGSSQHSVLTDMGSNGLGPCKIHDAPTSPSKRADEQFKEHEMKSSSVIYTQGHWRETRVWWIWKNTPSCSFIWQDWAKSTFSSLGAAKMEMESDEYLYSSGL